MHILVTGGAGFVGSHLAVELLQLGHSVAILDNLNDYYSPTQKRKNLPQGATFVEGSLLNVEDVRRASQGVDVVVHLAGMAGVGYSVQNPEIYFKVNVMGSLNLFMHSNCTSIVYASSSSVYGNSEPPATGFNEDLPCNNPVSPYAASKKALEVMCESLAHTRKWKMIGLRFFTVYGPRGRPDMAPYKFVDLIARGQAINQHGDGNTVRDYTYISDIVSGIVRSIDHVFELAPGTHTIYNLGNGHPIKLSTFISTVEKVVGKKAIVNVTDEKIGDVKATSANVDKAKNELGYGPKVNVEEGLTKVWEWYQKEILGTEAQS